MEAVKPLLLALALVFLIRVPFLNQAIQGDDHIYLTEAEHALIDPLHPSDVKYVFLGDEVDLRGHSHPPGNAWPLAALILLAGDVKEITKTLQLTSICGLGYVAPIPLATALAYFPEQVQKKPGS